METLWQIAAAQPLAVNEVWQNCCDLGISKLVRTRQCAAADTVTFDVESQTALTDNPLFAYKAQVRIRRVDDGVASYWFLGRVTSIPRDGESKAESQSMTISGPWDWLEHTIYRQGWQERAGLLYKARVVLYQAANGTSCTTGAQISDALSWGISGGAPAAVGVIDAGFYLPMDERVNIMCSAAICEALSYQPNLACWFDYSQRLPVFHCRDRFSLAANSVAVADVFNKIKIDSRQDLQVPAVAICFERTDSLDGADQHYTSIQYAPVVAGETAVQTQARLSLVDVVWAAFDLQGGATQMAKADIEVEDFPDSYTDKDWWKARVPWLVAYDDANITLANGQRMGDSDLESILVSGTVEDWMSQSAEPERICVDVSILVKDGAGVVLEDFKRPVTLWVTATDAETGSYSKVISFDSGELEPPGVAAGIYAAWSALHYEGSIVVEELECAGIYSPGTVINLTGGVAEWTGMNAMVIRSTEDVDQGTTTVEFGPIRWMDVNSLVGLFRATRFRRFAFNANYRTSGSGTQDFSASSASGDTPVAQAQAGHDSTRVKVLRDPAAAVDHRINLDSTAFTFGTSGDGTTPRIIQPREIYVVYDDAGTKKAKKSQVLCSALYGAETALGSDLANGTATGQILYWTGSAWAVATVGSLAAGDLLQWNGSVWVKVTPTVITVVTDFQVDAANKVIQKKTRANVKVVAADAESAWATITGGAMVQGVTA